MKNVFLFLADGFEEIEAIATIDVLRRAEVNLTTVSITNKKEVSGAHSVTVLADSVFDSTNFDNADMLILPGGMPGTTNLNNHEGLKQLLLDANAQGKQIAAICAAPLVLGGLGLLDGKTATCYPSFETQLGNANHTGSRLEVDGNITTSKGPGTAIEFGLQLVKTLVSEEKAKELAQGMIVE